MLSALKTHGAGCTVFFQQVVCCCLCEFKVGADGRDRCPVRFLFSSDGSLMSYISTVCRHQHRMQQHYCLSNGTRSCWIPCDKRYFHFRADRGKAFPFAQLKKKKNDRNLKTCCFIFHQQWDYFHVNYLIYWGWIMSNWVNRWSASDRRLFELGIFIFIIVYNIFWIYFFKWLTLNNAGFFIC